MVIDELFKKKRSLNFTFQFFSQVFCKVKFGYWYLLICSYVSTYIRVIDFDLFSRHN